jgi:hypothetical protein
MVLGGGGHLGRRCSNQRRTKKGQNSLSHCSLPDQALCKRRQMHIACCVLEITFDDGDYYAKADHEAASKFIGQKRFREFSKSSPQTYSLSHMAC